MTKVISQENESWTMRKIQSLIEMETAVLKKQLTILESKILGFENRHGKLNREALYGQVDDMELIEWEGEIETLARLRQKLTALEQIAFEYE